MPRLLVAGKLHPSGVARLEQLSAEGVDITHVQEISEPSYAPYIDEADALVIRTQPLSAETIAKAKRLKVVSRHGVGYDAVDLQALNSRKIALAVAGDVNSISVAEHAMMQLLAGAKQAIRADRAVRNPDDWGWRNRLEQREIFGKNLFIIGFGRAGQRLAKMASGFDMQVRAYDPYLQANGWPTDTAEPEASLKEGLAWADYLSLHLPRGDKPLLAEPEFAAMKPGIVIANTARGGIICEKALASALASGRVHAAGIDVFETEPPTPDLPLADLSNTILSPHTAGLTEEASERMALASIENAMNYLNQTIDPALIVNRNALT
ncbi:hydroxyacid dehydrogenase [Thalassococcus lentus]|uniref:Hydroxyacid dehydrogenase n=1 Tax=Thalassococcus lentus TaxID=1210524 RepID=A0ABT4XUA3_9RHOB|nr:hydroxyacid dehydrogenase [Thalassococcus lentus]MDA7425542.1 hydroxyacid dehydrogenase [Thalassococcus lentus]